MNNSGGDNHKDKNLQKMLKIQQVFPKFYRCFLYVVVVIYTNMYLINLLPIIVLQLQFEYLNSMVPVKGIVLFNLVF